MPRAVTAPILLAVFLAAAAFPVAPSGGRQMPAQAPQAPAPASGTLRFAVIGDNGTGDGPQYDVGEQMALQRREFPFNLVLMLGDNIYGRASPEEFRKAFERPYATLLDAGVRFYATLGNHDHPDNRFYPGFNMEGRRYYTFVRDGVRFVTLDTNVLDDQQLAWFDAALQASAEPWKIVYFHHAIYSNGSRHGSNVELRVRLEPILVRHGVQVVLSGHDHHYERLKPQKGVTYFVAGAGGKLRKGMRASAQTAAAYDGEQSFMVVEIDGERLSFRAISRTGRVVDAGVIHRSPAT